MQSFPIVALILFVSACVDTSTDATFQSLQKTIGNANLEANFSSATLSSRMPKSGKGEYKGYLGVFEAQSIVAENIDYFAVGSAQLEVNFSDLSATGSASNFFEVDPKQVANVTSASISGVALSGSLKYDDANSLISGTLVKSSGEKATYTFSKPSFSYYGTTGQSIRGQGLGLSEAAGRETTVAGFAATLVRESLN